MKAMILAAGVGSRLRPLTDTTPKALVEVGGMTMLEITIRRLKMSGVAEIIVNAHHHAQQIKDFLKKKNYFDIRMEISEESTLLDTGGGLKKASYFFDDETPFFLHNADTLSTVDLLAMYRAHLKSGALATLAVKTRESSRLLAFNADGNLCGRQAVSGGKTTLTGDCGPSTVKMGFGGIHVISPAIFPLMTESGVFSITNVYLRLALAGETIRAFDTASYYWKDIGSLEKLEAARSDFREKRYQFDFPPDIATARLL